MKSMYKIKEINEEMVVSGKDRINDLLEDYNRSDPCICIIRAKAITEAYNENAGAPTIIKKAKAFKKICEQIPIKIYDSELIVGSSGAYRRSAGVSPEISWQWIKEEIETIESRDQDPYYIEEEGLRELMEDILPQWKGRSVEEAFLARVPEETADIAVDTGIIDNDSKWRCAVGEITPDYQDILFIKGFNGIIEDAKAGLKGLDLSKPQDIQKSYFYNSVIECGKGIICLSDRYAQAAEQLAFTEKNGERKEELIEISKNCRHVPGNPPKTFWQAIQMAWIIQLGNSLGFEETVFRNRLAASVNGSRLKVRPD